MRHTLVIATALVLTAGVAVAGSLSHGLETQMAAMKGSDEITVLVVMKDQVDVPALNRELHAAKAPMRQRHAMVVGDLQAMARRTQGSLLAALDADKASGLVMGYTPHWIVNGVVVRTTVDGARRLAKRDDVATVEADLRVELIKPVNDPASKAVGDKAIGIAPGVVAVGARRVWDELGIDGSSRGTDPDTPVIVGTLDTGVDGTHPALASRWQGNWSPTSQCWLDAANLGDATPVDQHYHGTHTMGTITGLAPGDTIGIAPGAHWIASNVINQGSGSAFDNGVIASFEFMADPDGDPQTTADMPVVVQNSWGVNESFSGYYDCDSRWWAAIDNCEAAGVVVTWSAGNEGPGSTTLRSPADRAETPYNCFSVGATENFAPYTIADFSSRGPSGCGGAYATKPEISAPGVHIYSAEPGGGYQYLDGTSMAGPHVAGVVALMRSANPDIDVDTVKQILMDTAIDLGAAGEDNTYGWGFVDGYAAVLAVLQGYGTSEGYVTDSATGDPIEGATVVVEGVGRSKTTDAAGFFHLMLPQGDYTYDYSAFGYLPGSQALTIAENETVSADIALDPAPTALLSGHVYDDESAPIEGATITALDTPLAPATTDTAGYYELSLPTGSVYEILAGAYGMGSQQASIDMQDATVQDFTLPALVFDNFENGSLTLFPWQTAGDADWFVTGDDAYEGIYSARSGDINDYGSTELSVTVDVLATGNVEFYYRVSSETSYDFLHFAIDGVEQGSWSGEVAWTLASFPVTDGHHTFTWTYDKDLSVSSGSDCAWVDYVVFPTIAPPAYPDMAMSPPEMTQTLAPAATAQQMLTMDNNGDGELVWSAVATIDAPAAAALSARFPELKLAKGEEDPRTGGAQLLGSGGPDGFGYSWIDSDEFGGPTFDWVEINTVGTALADGDDVTSAPLPMGFTFPFYGTDYTTMSVCSNGWASPTATVSTYTNSAIPSTSDPNNLIAPFWDDLNPVSAGTVYYYADTENSRFVVEWDGVVRYGTSDPETFEVVYNDDGSIVFQYKTMTGTLTGATVGVENAGGTDGLEIVYNGAYVRDGLAVKISAAPLPVPWLSLTETSGTVPAHTAGAQFPVVFDATDTPEGVYTGSVVITTNDPAHAQTVIPVTLTVTTQTAVEDGVPTVFSLGRAVPNPFNPQTRIAYAVPAGGGRIVLKIFDLSGRTVRTLIDGNADAGNHTAVWSGVDDAGRRVASGTYFYRLEGPGFSRTRKMVMVK